MRKLTGYWSFTSSTTGRWRKQIKGKEERKVGRLLELHIKHYRKVEEADQR